MDIIERIECDLSNNNSTNYLYQLAETETDRMNQIRTMLNEDHGFIDVVLDSEEFAKFTKGIDTTYNDVNKRIAEIRIRLLDHMANIFKSRERKVAIVSLHSLSDLLKDIANEQGKKGYRIHAIMDDMHLVSMQRVINDIYNYKGLVVMGYTSKTLSTYKDSEGESIHKVDVESQAKIYEIRNKYKDFLNRVY